MEVVKSVPLLERVNGGGDEKVWTRNFSSTPRGGISHP
jgi:hypothetical protein